MPLAAGLDHGQAVVARVDVEEVGLEGLQDVVAQAEAQHILVEPAQRPRRSSRAGRRGPCRACRCGSPRSAVPARTALADVSAPWKASSLVPAGSAKAMPPRTPRSAAVAAGSRSTATLAASSRPASASSAAASSTSQPNTFCAVSSRGDDDALLAVVHAELECAARALDQLQPEELRSVLGPIVHFVGSQAGVSERAHCRAEGHGACSCRSGGSMRAASCSRDTDCATAGSPSVPVLCTTRSAIDPIPDG